MDSETVKALLELKEKFNEIGHAYLQTKLPLELSQISEVLEPFIDLGNTLNETISKVRYNDAKVWPKDK